MRNRTAFILSVITLITFIFVTPSFAVYNVEKSVNGFSAAEHTKGHKHRLARKMRFLAQHLELTDEQKEQIKVVIAEQREVTKPLREQLNAVRKELRLAGEGGQFNESLVKGLAEKQAQVLSVLIVEKERVRIKIYNLLTPEQQSKLKDLKENFKDRRKNNE